MDVGELLQTGQYYLVFLLGLVTLSCLTFSFEGAVVYLWMVHIGFCGQFLAMCD
jgi:hypothetical protein